MHGSMDAGILGCSFPCITKCGFSTEAQKTCEEAQKTCEESSLRILTKCYLSQLGQDESGFLLLVRAFKQLFRQFISKLHSSHYSGGARLWVSSSQSKPSPNFKWANIINPSLAQSGLSPYQAQAHEHPHEYPLVIPIGTPIYTLDQTHEASEDHSQPLALRPQLTLLPT